MTLVSGVVAAPDTKGLLIDKASGGAWMHRASGGKKLLQCFFAFIEDLFFLPQDTSIVDILEGEGSTGLVDGVNLDLA